MHAPTADRFYDIKNSFPVSEHIEYGRELPQVLGKGPIPNQMTGNPEQFTHHDPDNLCPLRHLNTRQLFYRQQIRQVIVDPPEVINPVGVWNVGVPRLALGHFFGAAMMKTNIRYRIHNILTVQLKNYSENAVCARVLWSDV